MKTEDLVVLGVELSALAAQARLLQQQDVLLRVARDGELAVDRVEARADLQVPELSDAALERALRVVAVGEILGEQRREPLLGFVAELFAQRGAR